jgi:hypothetical protein
LGRQFQRPYAAELSDFSSLIILVIGVTVLQQAGKSPFNIILKGRLFSCHVHWFPGIFNCRSKQSMTIEEPFVEEQKIVVPLIFWDVNAMILRSTETFFGMKNT